jgi:uncharacterized membrane protein YphA (DoxX/SURF4 family)
MVTQTNHVGQEPSGNSGPVSWSLPTRILFRFCFAYFGMYVIFAQMLTTLILIPGAGIEIPQLDSLWPVRQIVSATAKHVFRVASALVITGSGSGDKMFDWVEAFCLLVFAITVTAVWSALDHKRKHYVAMHKWFHLCLRFALGSTLLVYGFDKVIPVQMPFPFLSRLLEPFGNFSPMGVLWYSIGASPAYEIFTGCAEVLGGILVLLPRTATLGALICLADSTQVFALNMTYDVPVKLFSFHLILLSLVLLAPDAPRLANLFFRDRAAGPSTQPPLFRSQRANRIAASVQALLALYFAGVNLYAAAQNWKQYGGGAPKPALYGIWNVETMSIDGQVRSPLVTDYDRWRRVLFQSMTTMTFQRMDETFATYTASYAGDKKISLTKGTDKNWNAGFAFQRRAQDQLVLDGDMDSHKVHMELRLVDHKKFLLTSRGFHWIQEHPFNR